MSARDLSKVPPRRWSEELGGIKWLPRLIDKTRATQDGTLGPYLFGQSPMDRSFLRAIGLRHRDLSRIVANSATDDDVFRAIFAQTPDGVERARIWSANLQRRHGWFLFILDLDDGYLDAWHWRVLRVPTTAAANLLTAVVKRIWPVRVR